MSDTDVELAVRWTEAGANIPAKTAAGLQGIKTAAGEAAPAVGDRMSQAFARLEAREPTMVLRRSRMAIEEMALSAVGAQGPMARMAASFALLGGAEGLAALGAIGAIGFEIKTLVGLNDELEKSLVKSNTQFAQMVGGVASLRAKMAELAVQAKEVHDTMTDPGFVERIKILMTGGAGATTFVQGQLSQTATLQNEQALAAQQISRTREEAQLRATTGLLRHISAEPTGKAIRDLIGRRDDLVKLGDEAAQAWAKAFLGAVRHEDPQQQLKDLLGQHGVFEKLGGEAFREFQAAWLAASAAAAPGLTPHRQLSTAEFMQRTKPGELGPALTPLSTFDLRGPGELALAAGRSFTAPAFGSQFHPLTNRPEGSEKPGEAADRNAERNAEKMASVLGRELGPLIAAFSGGGARGAIGGAGAITGTLASLNDPKGNALLGTAAPYLSLASGVLSGISSLFGGGQKPKVIITAFEDAALREMKQLRGEPLTTQVIVVGAVDMRNVQQALSRLNKLGIIPRLP